MDGVLLNDVDEARRAYARCLQVGGLSAKLASIAGARLMQASEDAKGLDELADDTPTNAWVSVAPQLLGAAFTPSSTYSPTRPWFRLLRRRGSRTAGGRRPCCGGGLSRGEAR